MLLLKAQGLKEIITTYLKFNRNERHYLYLMKSQVNGISSLVGMLKIGEKRLFVFDHMGKHHEISPLCVLDFYVVDSKQRRGFGRKLFDTMLIREKVRPEHLAIDSPSEKCLSFLKKHYGLKQPIMQTNNYVIFPGFFDNRSSLCDHAHQNNHNSILPYSAKSYFRRNDDLSHLNVILIKFIIIFY